MQNLRHLHRIREREVGDLIQHLPREAKILELGGGTGYQAKLLSERGYQIQSIDIASSNYEATDFPIIQFDGSRIPFGDRTFDVVLSSSVLEHVANLESFTTEMNRVLKPGGHMIHIMPTGLWQFWSSLTQLLGFVPRSLHVVRNASSIRGLFGGIYYALRASFPPNRHGEKGTAFAELFLFSKYWWKRRLKALGYDVVEARPLRLFYTGNALLGERLGIRTRQRLSSVLGSAVVLYHVRIA